MVRPTPPTIGQASWGQSLLNALDYATDQGEQGVADAAAAQTAANTANSGLAAKANSADVTTALAGKANTTHTHAIADVTNLQTNLDAKAADNAVVKLTGAQTVAGVKTFSSAPVVPDDSFAQAKVTGLTTALAAKLEDVAYADLPAGVTLTVYWTGTTWPSRPTSRTDIPVIWTGGTDAVPPPSSGFEGIDKWDKEVA